MTRVMIAFLVLSLGMLAAPRFAAQGTASGQVASVEGTVKDAGKTATREVTDSGSPSRPSWPCSRTNGSAAGTSTSRPREA